MTPVGHMTSKPDVSSHLLGLLIRCSRLAGEKQAVDGSIPLAILSSYPAGIYEKHLL